MGHAPNVDVHLAELSEPLFGSWSSELLSVGSCGCKSVADADDNFFPLEFSDRKTDCCEESAHRSIEIDVLSDAHYSYLLLRKFGERFESVASSP